MYVITTERRGNHLLLGGCSLYNINKGDYYDKIR